MSSPLVSVVIPAFNAEKFLAETLDSVLSQTFLSWESIVVDDGSTDATNEIAARYLKDERVKYIKKENEGVSKARNYAIERSKGKYIALLDADDIWMPQKLEKQVALLEKNENIGLCYTGAIKVDEKLEFKEYVEAEEFKDDSEALLLKMNILILSSAIIRKDILLKTDGFDSKFSTCADKELWLRLSLLTKFASVPDYLVKYRDVGGSMSSDPELSKRDTLNVLNKFFDQPNLPTRYKKLKNKSLSNNLMVVSGEFLHSGKFRESLACMYKALYYNPLNLKQPLGLPFRFFKRLFT